MLKANKSRWFEKIFSVYNRNLLKRRFHSLQVAGLDFLRNRNKEIPLIIYANHSSWWDGLIAFEISRKAKMDAFVMMEEKHLRKLFLFRRLGAFSVVREKTRKALESINYASELLSENSGRTLWIFPQGEILPNDSRPLKFYNGISKIIEKFERINIIPLAIRYEFLGEFKPQIFVKIGQPDLIESKKLLNRKELTNDFENRLTQTLQHLKCDIINNNLKDFEKLI